MSFIILPVLSWLKACALSIEKCSVMGSITVSFEFEKIYKTSYEFTKSEKYLCSVMYLFAYSNVLKQFDTFKDVYPFAAVGTPFVVREIRILTWDILYFYSDSKSIGFIYFSLTLFKNF